MNNIWFTSSINIGIIQLKTNSISKQLILTDFKISYYWTGGRYWFTNNLILNIIPQAGAGVYYFKFVKAANFNPYVDGGFWVAFFVNGNKANPDISGDGQTNRLNEAYAYYINGVLNLRVEDINIDNGQDAVNLVISKNSDFSDNVLTFYIKPH